MDCPQCGATLAAYVLDGREAVVCESCGYVGIPADHSGEGSPDGEESWDDALRRYHEHHPPVGEAGARVPVVASQERSPGSEESWDEALARFARVWAGSSQRADAPGGGLAAGTRARADDAPSRAGEAAESESDGDGADGSTDREANGDDAHGVEATGEDSADGRAAGAGDGSEGDGSSGDTGPESSEE